jgi:hypothetical protein
VVDKAVNLILYTDRFDGQLLSNPRPALIHAPVPLHSAWYILFSPRPKARVCQHVNRATSLNRYLARYDCSFRIREKKHAERIDQPGEVSHQRQEKIYGEVQPKPTSPAKCRRGKDEDKKTQANRSENRSIAAV